jgi:hypothetical protein
MVRQVIPQRRSRPHHRRLERTDRRARQVGVPHRRSPGPHRQIGIPASPRQ